VIGVGRRDVTWGVAVPPPALLPGRDLQVLFPPDPSYPLAVHLPSFPAQDRVLLGLTQARIAAGKLVQAPAQVFLVGHHGPSVALG
jgi:hypothetical protein